MANYRNQGSDSFSIGSAPPTISWTFVRGDTPAFRVYVTDSDRLPLNVPEWNIKMDIIRPDDSGAFLLSLTPSVTGEDDEGEFTVSLTAEQSEILETGDIFDIQLSDDIRVWTVCRGSVIVIEDVTGPYES